MQERSIISTDNETGGREGFVVIYRISVMEERVVRVQGRRVTLPLSDAG